jgi:CRP/FNR family transcriptional regulator, cyclic AMP receptor protein
MPADPQFLSEIKLFSSLDEEERKVLAGAAAERSLAPGETLFRTGDPGDALFLVRAGAIDLFTTDTMGQKIVLHTAQPGEYFGELSLLDEGPRTATAQATEQSELVAIDRDDLLQLFKKRPDAALHMLATVGAMTRRADAMLRQRSARNVNEAMEVQSTMLQRIADAIAAFSGSMPFLMGNAAAFFIWIAWNVIPWELKFDPYPFGLLTMIVSLEAIFLSCFVLISQDRQAAKDRVRSDIEYEINIKAELEVAHLHEKTDKLYEEVMQRLSRMEKEMRRSPTTATTSTPS